MTDTVSIKAVINRADVIFRSCHELLRRQPSDSTEYVEGLLTIQGRLARGILALETEIALLKKQRKILTRSKLGVPADELNERYRNYASHIKALGRAIDYGKVLGDAFVWLFCSKEEELLRRHSEHERVQHLPMGIGGIGEVEFISNAPMFGGKLVLYHGITTFLRIGDASLVNLKTGKIEGMVELKSLEAKNNEVKVTINYVGEALPFASASNDGTITRADFRRQLGDSIYATLNRQTKEISSALSANTKTPKRPFNSKPGMLFFNPSPLETLHDTATLDRASSLQVSPGLTLVGIKLPVKSLAEKVLNEIPFDGKPVLEATKGDIKNILLKDSTDNSISIGYLVYPNEERYEQRFGHTPVFWWPVKATVLDDLIKGSFLVMSCFNPAHIIKTLGERGIIVKSNPPGRKHSLTVSYCTDKTITLHGLDYFLSMVPRNLINENSLIDFLCTLVAEFKKRDFKKPTKLGIAFSFTHSDGNPDG